MSMPHRVYATPEITKAKAGKIGIADNNSDDDHTNKENQNPNLAVLQITQAVQQLVEAPVRKKLTVFPKASFKTPKNRKTVLQSIISKDTKNDNDNVDDKMPTIDDLSVFASKYRRRRCDCGLSGHVSVRGCDLCSKTKKTLDFN